MAQTEIQYLENTIRRLNNNYYNHGVQEISDVEYDKIVERLQEIDPENSLLNEVGSDFSKDRQTLPYFLPSLEKIKPENTRCLPDFLNKYSVNDKVISEKLDGISCLFYKDENNNVNLFTRGNGYEGTNITYIIEHLNNGTFIRIISQICERYNEQIVAIRGELIISTDIFQEKYAKDYENSRNLVAGMAHFKELTPERISRIRDTKFIAYELIFPSNILPSEQMDCLFEVGFTIPQFDVVSNSEISNEYLMDMLQQYKEDSPYEIDGLVLADDGIHETKIGKKFPEFRKSFKMQTDDQSAIVVVKSVEWNITKDRKLMPVVIIPPTVIESENGNKATVQRATAYNGKFILDNKINTGAVIKIIRSGDVIPKIVEIITPSNAGALPSNDIMYVWDSNRTHFILENTIENDICEKQIKIREIEFFFKKIGVKGMSIKTVEKFVNAGYQNIFQFIEVSDEELISADIEGIGEKTIRNIKRSILESLQNTTLVTLAHASNLFNGKLGEKKLELLLQHFPNIFNINTNTNTLPTKEQIISIKGFSNSSAQIAIDGAHRFREFYKRLNEIADLGHGHGHGLDNFTEMEAETETETKDSDDINYMNKVFIFSGFRDQNLERKIKNKGGKVVTSMTNEVTTVVCKDLEKLTGKIKKAQEKGLEIILQENL